VTSTQAPAQSSWVPWHELAPPVLVLPPVLAPPLLVDPPEAVEPPALEPPALEPPVSLNEYWPKSLVQAPAKRKHTSAPAAHRQLTLITAI
jgi:hypothetical protein